MDAETFAKMALQLHLEKKSDDALAACNAALSIDADCANAWLVKGTVLMAGDQWRDALVCFEHAQRLGNERAADGIAICREALGESSPPSQVAPESAANSTATTWFYKGEDLDRQGQPADALACFERALAMDPGSAYIWYSKGVVLGKLGRPEEELASYDQALRLKPGFPEAWFNKGITLGTARRFREALECFTEAHQQGYPEAEQGIRFCQQSLATDAPVAAHAATCPKCNFAITSADNFCGECGHKLR